MRKLALLLAVVLPGFCSIGQTQAIDSLKQSLRNSHSDTARGRLLESLAHEYMHVNADTGYLLAQEAVAIARQYNLPDAERDALNVSANCIFVAGNYASALEHYLAALKIAERTGSNTRKGTILNNISNVYDEIGEHHKAIEFSKRGLEAAGNNITEVSKAITYINIGDSYESLGILDSARYFVTMANDIAKKINDIQLIAGSYCLLGNVYFKMKELGIALGYYQSAFPLFQSSEDTYWLSTTTLGLAQTYKALGNKDSALFYARYSYAHAQSQKMMPNIIDACSFLSENFKELKMVDSAYTYLGLMIAAKDSLHSAEKTRRLQDLVLQQAVYQLQVDREKIQASQERSANIQYAIIAITVLTFVIVFLALSRSVIVNENWIKFLGVLGLLLVFEFINLIFHPLLASITHHSPIWMLLIMVAIAALLVPLHHRLEHFIVHQLTAKNKQIRLAAAKKTVAKLEKESE